MAVDTVQKYLNAFGNLHRNRNPKWGGAPHKPILLLSVLDRMERGEISTNRIELTPELVAGFRDYWRVLVPRDTWQERIATPFRPNHVREDRDETGYYVRHALFPSVVKSLYNYACAVCGLNVHIDTKSTLVDVAHIMPFGLFHNDDPRNGVALCKNHHWGFDAGWFTATDDYKIVVSPHLQSALAYVNAGALLLLPAQREYAPAPEALAWHQQHVYRR